MRTGDYLWWVSCRAQVWVGGICARFDWAPQRVPPLPLRLGSFGCGWTGRRGAGGAGGLGRSGPVRAWARGWGGKGEILLQVLRITGFPRYGKERIPLARANPVIEFRALRVLHALAGDLGGAIGKIVLQALRRLSRCHKRHRLIFALPHKPLAFVGAVERLPACGLALAVPRRAGLWVACRGKARRLRGASVGSGSETGRSGARAANRRLLGFDPEATNSRFRISIMILRNQRRVDLGTPSVLKSWAQNGTCRLPNGVGVVSLVAAGWPQPHPIAPSTR